MEKRLIKNHVLIKVVDGALLINTLTGYVGFLKGEEIDIFLRVRDGFSEERDYNSKTYIALEENHFFMSREEEKFCRENIISMLQDKKKDPRNLKGICLVMTYNCNFACPYCFEKEQRRDVTLNQQQIDKIFELQKDIKYIGLYGGEPLLPEHRELIDYIIEKKPFAAYSVISNGYYLEEYVDVFSKVKVTNIQITLDGDEQTHNRTRILAGNASHDGTYKKIMTGIRKAVDSDIPITIRINVHDGSLDCSKKLVNQLNEEFAGKLKFEMQPLFQYGLEKRESLYSELRLNAHVKNSIEDRCIPLLGWVRGKAKLRPILQTCGVEGSYNIYDPNGNIYSCMLAVGDASKSIGTYYPEYRLKKESFKTRDITTIENCSNCPNALLCGGGCPNAIAEEKDINTPVCENFAEAALTISKMKSTEFFVG